MSQQIGRIDELGESLEQITQLSNEQKMTIADLVEQVRREKTQSDEYLQELIAQKNAFGDSGRALF